MFILKKETKKQLQCYTNSILPLKMNHSNMIFTFPHLFISFPHHSNKCSVEPPAVILFCDRLIKV